MSFSYKPLWRTLVEKDMIKEDLKQGTGLARTTMAKMSKNENVALSVLDKICEFLECPIDEVIEYVKDNDVSKK